MRDSTCETYNRYCSCNKLKLKGFHDNRIVILKKNLSQQLEDYVILLYENF